MALWSGRFEEGVGKFTQEFGASLPIDKHMYAQDIQGSIAHAKMLAKQDIISQFDADRIEVGLMEIRHQIDKGLFTWDINDEDIHMAVEKTLIEDIGQSGARLHTGRSRNDQVATDIRLHAKFMIKELMEQNCRMRESFYNKAEKHYGVIMPGFTHLQHAQPVLFSHHLLAYFWMFTRDYKRLYSAYQAADANPLGSAALAGTTYPIDRQMTTELLGFDHPTPNSLDAVSDRDYLLDLEYACSVAMMHLSRLCEEIVMWSTTEFAFITLADSYSTGSSIMPQKKNPDFAELTRGKMGRVVGDLVGLLVTMKSLPLAYNKDLQECKEGAVDAAKTLNDCMIIMDGMIDTMKVHPKAMRKGAGKGFTAATDVADYLAKKGMPFRQAHEVVGNLVLYCEKNHKGLENLTLEEFKKASALFEEDIVSALDLEAIVRARTTYGGTGHSAVKVQMGEAAEALAADKELLDTLK
ncbi:Argininosuccinate lyase [Slackia heliotrinireducens]|uniref:Argininosuccinate lyase n=1 Tax=Slackia heliotrinireducens (strain ATCC 29202 / DSM 20476 / NCTC 11029 / RHS 1) TaxID=471855 RepID=C7N3D4_SLAHD|nr:argininosuccinate lyase [Slackia heliotrinireducens]ACV23657.1 argininosuccinate lyase [Slackia heliotrinireducens DSM 20476]VEH03182.1 Argininosuccinate lyase [Slackia heliotrinireducens]